MPRFEPMTAADLDTVTELEREIHPFPWTQGNFADSLAAGYDAWIMREGGALVGYAVAMLAVDEAHLLNISIVADRRRAGRGSALLGWTSAQASRKGARRLLLEVRGGNDVARAFYRHHGFVEIGRRRGYYPAHDGREDACVMAREI